MKNKVGVAISGGVDSSVTLYLLKKKGYDVTGFHMWLFGELGEVAKRAEETCKILGVPFELLDLRKEFQKNVIETFAKEYKEGLTPNPCVICNREIKFGLLYKTIMDKGFDYFATGHYVRIKNGSLIRGLDKTKDQSYFLWQLKEKDLKNIIFPLGDKKKSDIKVIAKSLNLPAYKVKESQEICFIPDTLNKFIGENIGNDPGEIITKEGKVLGDHKGLWYYTIGQRKGIELSLGPWYVMDKDFKNNRLIVTRTENNLKKKTVKLVHTNWNHKLDYPFSASIKIRYRHPAYPAVIYKDRAVFKTQQRAITPGQSAVIYKYGKVLGGGIIKE